MVLRERIELSASPLPRECSTTELPQLSRKQILLVSAGVCRIGPVLRQEDRSVWNQAVNEGPSCVNDEFQGRLVTGRSTLAPNRRPSIGG
jgi:hypothetical protein